MDYEAYRKAYFADPMPQTRFGFSGTFGVTLYIEDFDSALSYYQQVLGPPAYVEGPGTRGWQIGSGWLTLLQGKSGNPHNVEITLQVETPQEAGKLQGPSSQPAEKAQPLRMYSCTSPFTPARYAILLARIS